MGFPGKAYIFFRRQRSEVYKYNISFIAFLEEDKCILPSHYIVPSYMFYHSLYKAKQRDVIKSIFMPQTQDHMAVQILVLYKTISYCFICIDFQQKFYKLLTSLQFCQNVLKKENQMNSYCTFLFLLCAAILALNLP